jgi:hypothetical protein
MADVLVARLDFSSGVGEALACPFERWNGKGFPAHVEGAAIPLAMRVVHLSHDMEAIGRIFSVDRALEAAQDRRCQTYDPALADLFIEPARWRRVTTRNATGPAKHTHTRADTGDLAACLLAATEIYVGLTTERADRNRSRSSWKP